jgi:hypothetical protein
LETPVEIVIRTEGTETVVKPEAGTSGTVPAALQQGTVGADARSGISAGSAPTPPGPTGVPTVNVAATEPPRAATGADQPAGEAPALS